MAHETDLRKTHFVEGSTPRIGYTLKDAADATITTALDTQEASIYDVATGTVVPTWTDLDISGAQGNTVTSGVGVWDLPASATAKIGTDEYEDHVIAIKGTYDTDKVLKHFILIRVYRQVIGG